MQPQSYSKPIRIVIADEQSSFCGILRRQLEREPGILVVGEACEVSATASLTQRLKPDILLIDHVLNRKLALKTERAASPVVTVALVSTAEIRNVVEAFELGARGVVMKTTPAGEWRMIVQSVLAGQYWVENEGVAALLQAARELLVRSETKTSPEFGLTLRELEIAGKIVAGRSNKEVGREFSICERTVKHHLTNIFRKVGVSTRLELAVLMRDTMPPSVLSSDITNRPRVTDEEKQDSKKNRLYLVAEP